MKKRADNVDTVDTVENKPVGNTKKCLRARFWIFTWNNYPEKWRDTITQGFDDAEKYVMQPEKGESGTKHIQGYVQYKNARSFDSLQKLIPKAHWEKTRSRDAIKYCMKEETRDGEPLYKGVKIPKPYITVFHEWQTKLLETFTGEPDPRKIIWIVDEKGGKGKTTFCKHVVSTRNDALYVCGKASDIKYGITQFVEESDIKIVLLDYTRSLEAYVSYEGIETIKNGIFYNTKYESKQVLFDTPHVVAFSNFHPDEDKLSGDRWDIRTI